MTWTQPLCRSCWFMDRDHHGRPNPRPPSERKLEVCCMCGDITRSGIYAIYNPAAVPYPTTED